MRTREHAETTHAEERHPGHRCRAAHGGRGPPTLRPAPADSASSCSRGSIPRAPRGSPRSSRTSSTRGWRRRSPPRATGAQRGRVSTVEHLLAALAGLGIDNASSTSRAAEVPIMDGSAAPFVFLVAPAGIAEAGGAAAAAARRQPVRWSDGDVEVSLAPHDGLRIDIEIDFDHPAFERRHARAVHELSPTTFVRELCQLTIRTFGFLTDLEGKVAGARPRARRQSRQRRGARRVLRRQRGHLRYADEFVRHKMLDAVGDLALLGHRLLGSFRGYKSGHGANQRTARGPAGGRRRLRPRRRDHGTAGGAAAPRSPAIASDDRRRRRLRRRRSCRARRDASRSKAARRAGSVSLRAMRRDPRRPGEDAASGVAADGRADGGARRGAPRW